MNTKIIFIGSPLGGDDGIGPYLYSVLKDEPKLKNLGDVELLELGVMGIDLISWVGAEDRLIIVDAAYSKEEVGKVILIEEKELRSETNIISQHDIGVEQTLVLLRSLNPKLPPVKIVGVTVQNIKAFTDQFSDELKKKLPTVKKEVLNMLLKLIENK